MKHGRGVWAAVFTLALGTGFGLALAGRFRRALIWLAADAVMIGLFIVTPWAAYALLALHVGSAIDAYLVGRRSEQPLRWLTPWPATLFVSTILLSLAMRGLVVEAFRMPSSSMYPTMHINDHFFVDKLTNHWHGLERGELVTFVYPCDPRRDYIKRVAAIAGDTVEVRCNVLYVNAKAVPAELVNAEDSYEDYDEMDNTWYHKQSSRYREVIDGRSYETFHDADRPARDRNPNRTDGDSRDFPLHAGTAPPSCANAEDGGPHVEQVLGKVEVTKPEETARVCEPQVHYVVPPDHLFMLGDNRNNSNDSRIWGSVPISLVKGRVTGIWYSSGAHGLELGRIGRVK